MKTIRVYNPPIACTTCKLKVAIWEKLDEATILCYSCRIATKTVDTEKTSEYVELTQEGL